MNIIRRNPDEFTLSFDKENYADLSYWEATNELLPSPPSPITTSNSLIICHFDYFNKFGNFSFASSFSKASVRDLIFLLMRLFDFVK